MRDQSGEAGALTEALPVEGGRDAQIIDELAHLTETVERQGEQQQRILVDIFNRLAPGRTTAAPKSAEKGVNGKSSASEQAPERDGKTPKGNDRAAKDLAGAKKGESAPKVSQGQRPTLTELAPEREIRVISAPESANRDKTAPAGDNRPSRRASPPAHQPTPAEVRERRTVTLGEQPAPVPARVEATPTGNAPAPGKPKNASGFYLGADGRLRRPDGTFANKIEVRRFTKEQSGGTDNAPASGNNTLIAKALGLLDRKIGEAADNGAGDKVGLALGGAFWEAAKEVKGVADEVKGALDARGIQDKESAKAYAKDRIGKAWAALKDPFGRRGAENPPALPPPQGQDAPTPTPIPAAFVAGGEPSASSAEFNENAKQAQEAKEADRASAQSESQHHEVVERLDKLIEAAGGKGPGLFDSAAEALGDRLGGDGGGRKKKRGRGRGPGRRPNIGGGGRGPAGPGPAGPGKARRAIAKVSAVMPRVGGALGSVADAASMTGGLLSKAPGAVATAGRGAMALGGRAIPLIGAAMTAYDAYSGFTDEEGQRRAFGLKANEGPTLGQKSAMAAGKVLDLGGLTSGLSGLLADGAGALGMENLQQSLTFNSDDMATGIHDLFSNEKSYEAMGVKKGEEATFSQKAIANVARTLNMGGMVSGTAKLLGGIAEDLGFDGAKEALTFDTDDLASSLFDFFGPILREDKKNGDRMTINNSTARYDNSSARQEVTEADVKQAGKQFDFGGVEQANSLPDGYLNALAAVESGGNPLARNASGAAGLFQFMPDTVAGMGGFDPYNVQQATAAAAQLTKDNDRYFRKKMGRAPEGRELYLMHQQGMGGGTQLLQNRDKSALEVLTGVYKGDSGKAAAAIQQNGGRIDMTAGELAELQMSKYDKKYQAQMIARERGVTPIPQERAVDEQIKEAKAAPSLVLKSAANAAPVAQAETVPTGKGFSQVLDIQHEQAKAAVSADPAADKTGPQMVSLLSDISKTLKGSKTADQGGGNVTTNNNTTNNNYVSRPYATGGHDGFSYSDEPGRR